MTILQALYLQKTIDRFSSQSDLSARNHKQIFYYNDKVWFVDDTNVYRVQIDETSEEPNPTEKPINGAVFMFNPKTGQLFIRIVHTSEWAGLKSHNRLSEWRFAEKVANQFARSKSLPMDQRPDQFIPASYKWIEGVDMGNLLDFASTVVIRCSKLNLPFKACLKIEKFRDLIMNATEPRFLEFNLYDDWLLKRSSTSMSSYTAFSRLILILRALLVNEETAKMVLKPGEEIITEPNHIWPSLTDEQWINVEVGLRNLIISDFAMKNNIGNESNLTNIQIREIILGESVKITHLPRHRQPTDDTKNDKLKASEISTLQQQQLGLTKLFALLKNKMVSFLFC